MKEKEEWLGPLIWVVLVCLALLLGYRGGKHQADNWYATQPSVISRSNITGLVVTGNLIVRYSTINNASIGQNLVLVHSSFKYGDVAGNASCPDVEDIEPKKGPM